MLKDWMGSHTTRLNSVWAVKIVIKIKLSGKFLYLLDRSLDKHFMQCCIHYGRAFNKYMLW